MTLLQTIGQWLGMAVVVLIVIAVGGFGALMVLATANVPSPTADDRRTASRGCLLVVVAIAALILLFAY